MYTITRSVDCRGRLTSSWHLFIEIKAFVMCFITMILMALQNEGSSVTLSDDRQPFMIIRSKFITAMQLSVNSMRPALECTSVSRFQP